MRLDKAIIIHRIGIFVFIFGLAITTLGVSLGKTHDITNGFLLAMWTWNGFLRGKSLEKKRELKEKQQ